MNPNTQTGFLGRLGGGEIAVAKLCVIVGLASIAVVVVAARLPDTAKESLYWLQRGIVSVAILTLLSLFIRHPRHSSRPQGLTQPLGLSFCLALASLVTGFWPGVFAALVTPLLVVGFWLAERSSRA
ncbi:hypothetical protein [Streptomyces sp. NPDC020298]|uniref:hypothetical protein n=1 Tax=unclassified Streptomyces TaxID=2593676 RepID=UPI0033F3F20C